MVDDQKARLDQARVLRARAEQARRMSRQIGGEADRKSLLAYADGLDTKADELDPPQATPTPAPVTRHQNPVQMQQARVTPPATDDSDDQA